MEVKIRNLTHFAMGCTAASTTSIVTTILTVAGLIISSAITTAQGEPETEHRVSRSDVRAVLGDKLDPSFWPTRGRRSYETSEETEPPFWANRGRNVHELDDLQNLLEARSSGDSEERPPFWANRGRRYLKYPCQDKRINDETLYAEEPKWIILDRRDLITRQANDPFWVARGRRAPLFDTLATSPNEFWASRGKKNQKPPKRTGETIRALGLTSDQFWPARGKRETRNDYQHKH